MAPPSTPKLADPPLHYRSVEMEPFWDAAEEADSPICFHAGKFFADGRGGHGTTGKVAFGSFRKTFGALAFGGILDRHSGPRIVFESGDKLGTRRAPDGYYAVRNLQDVSRSADQISSEALLAHQLLHDVHPRSGRMRVIDIVGADRLLWSADYPHQESSLGRGASIMQAILAAVTPAQARMILGGTATDLFGL